MSGSLCCTRTACSVFMQGLQRLLMEGARLHCLNDKHATLSAWHVHKHSETNSGYSQNCQTKHTLEIVLDGMILASLYTNRGTDVDEGREKVILILRFTISLSLSHSVCLSLSPFLHPPPSALSLLYSLPCLKHNDQYSEETVCTCLKL